MKDIAASVILSLMMVTSLAGQDFNVLEYGAVGDGATLNTDAFQVAIEHVHNNGGGRLIVPSGIFLIGAIRMLSNVELHLLEEAVLLGSTNPEDYFKINRWKGLVMADSAVNIAITGGGTINGQGRKLALHIDSLFYAGEIDSSQYNFVEMRPKYYLRPQLIEFVRCKKVLVRDVTLRNAACWVQTHDRSEEIIIDNVTIISDAYWNNDGIDISDCRNVRITNCYVNSADDGICLKSHRTGNGCDSIFIANCIVRSSASALKFGTRSHNGFRNVEIKNIRVYDTFRSAIAIEAVDGGILEDVLVDSVHAVNTGNAIFIRLGKRNNTGETSTLRNVTIRNLYAEIAFQRPDYAYDVRGPALPFFHNIFPSSITGIPGERVENIVLEDIEIRYPGRGNKALAYAPLSRLEDIPEKAGAYPEFSMFGELPAWGFYIRHVDGLRMRNIRLSIEDPDYRPAIVLDDAVEVVLGEVHFRGDEKTDKIVIHNSTVDVGENVNIKYIGGQ